MVRFRLAVPVLAVLTVGSLTGCALLPFLDRFDPRNAPDSRAHGDGPNAGDCWATNYTDLAEWANWEGAGPVDCSDEHQSYTFLADELKVTVGVPFEGGYMSGELALAASEQCNDALERQFDWTPQARRLGLYFFVPTKKQWDDGDHRIRCDIAVTAFGSDFYNGDLDLESLPADIGEVKSDLAEHAVAYQLCLIGDGWGPYEGSKTRVVDCNGHYDWRWAGSVDYPADPGAEYPAEDDMYNFAVDACPALGIAQQESVYPYFPYAEWWDQGERAIECWFSTVDAPSAPI